MKNAAKLVMALTIYLCMPALSAQETGIRAKMYWRYHYLDEENQKRELNKTKHLKEKHAVDLIHPSQNEVSKYDNEGRIIFYSPDVKHSIKLGYTTVDQKSFRAFYKKGELVEKDSFVWEGKNLIASYHFNSKNKIIRRELSKYDSTFILEHTFESLKRGRLKELRKTSYEYYPDYSYKKITYYKKEKPHYYTVFDCNPVGRNVKKDSTYNCVKYDVDSVGNKIKVTVRNDRSLSWKTVEYYNEKEEVIADKTYNVDNNGKLMWAYYYIPGSIPQLSKFVSYRTLFGERSYKEYYKIENKYNNEKNCTESATYIKGRLKRKNTNSYNEKGMIATAERYNKRGKKKSVVNFEYEYY